MLKKVMVVLVVLAVTGILPLLSGCEKNEYKVHTEKTQTTSETHTVVQ